MLTADDWKGSKPAAEFTDVTAVNGSPVQADFGRVRRLIGAVPAQDIRPADRLAVTVPLTAAAAGSRLVYTLEGDVPAGLTIDSATGELVWTPTAADAGTHTVTVRVRDPFAPLTTDTWDVTVQVAVPVAPPVVPPVVPPAVAPRIAVGGGNGVARTFTTDGAPKLTLTPFGDFAGEVRVASGDVTGDGVADLIAAAGPGGGPHVKVFDGATGAEVASFFAFEDSLRNGAFVAAGDLDGDGRAEVVVGAGPGGGPRVRALRGADLLAGGTASLTDFFAGDVTDRGGVTAYQPTRPPTVRFDLDLFPDVATGVYVG